MSVVKCKECGHDIAESAEICPNCGHRNKRSVGFLLGLGIFLFPLIFSWFTLRKGHSTLSRIVAFGWLAFTILFALGSSRIEQSLQEDSSIPASTYSQKATADNKLEQAPIENINVSQILSDYESNEVAADNKYKGKIVRVTGVVNSIKKDLMDHPYLNISRDGEVDLPMFQASFDKSMNKTLGSISKGSVVTVTCKIDGLMMHVIGEDCQLN